MFSSLEPYKNQMVQIGKVMSDNPLNIAELPLLIADPCPI